MSTSTSINCNVRQWRRYPAYADSKTNWLKRVPADWSVVRLKFLASFCGGGTPSKDNLSFWKGDIPWVSPKDMKSEFVQDTEDHITEQAVIESSTRLVPDGVVLVVVRSGILRHSIPVAITRRRMALNQDMRAILPKPRINADYLAAVIRGHQAELLNEWSKQGATVESIEVEYLVNTAFPLPPLDEQHRIIAFLDRETAKIDALIAKNERLIELLQEKRTALISYVVTKGLDPNVPMKDSGKRWIGNIPKHWQLLPIRRIAKRVDVGIAEASTHAYRDTGIPIIRSTNVRRNYIDMSDLLFIDPTFAEKNRSKSLFTGDLVTTRTGANLGMTAIVPPELDASQCFTLLVTTLRSAFVSPFFGHVFNSTAGQFYFSIESWGAGQHNLSVPIIQEMPVPVPPVEEQTQIVKHIEQVTTLVDPLIAKVREAIEKLREYRTALISAAVTGKIDVREEVV